MTEYMYIHFQEILTQLEQKCRDYNIIEDRILDTITKYTRRESFLNYPKKTIYWVSPRPISPNEELRLKSKYTEK